MAGDAETEDAEAREERWLGTHRVAVIGTSDEHGPYEGRISPLCSREGLQKAQKTQSSAKWVGNVPEVNRLQAGAGGHPGL